MDTLRDSPQDPPPSAVLRGTGAALAGQGGHLPWWRRITIPFEVLIATVVVTAMLLLTALLVYQVSTSARQAIIAASDESAQRISQVIAERVHRIVDPAEPTIRLLAFDPVASASSLPARLRRLPGLQPARRGACGLAGAVGGRWAGGAHGMSLPDLPPGMGWFLLLAVLLLWLLGAHNRVTALKAAILAAWQQVDAVLQQRGQALAALLQAVAEPLASEASAREAVAQAQAQVQAAADVLRRAPVTADAVADLGKADAVLAAVLVRLVALVEQQPALLIDPAVAEPLQVLKAVPARLAFARQVFNDAGAAYNAATTQFPTRLLGSLLRFGRAGRF